MSVTTATDARCAIQQVCPVNTRHGDIGQISLFIPTLPSTTTPLAASSLLGCLAQTRVHPMHTPVSRCISQLHRSEARLTFGRDDELSGFFPKKLFELVLLL